MDPFVVMECQKVLPNRFGLTLAAAARSRALRRGAEPRLAVSHEGTTELALQEIAAGVFTPEELTPFLPGAGGHAALPPPDTDTELCGDGPARRRRTRLPSREAVH